MTVAAGAPSICAENCCVCPAFKVIWAGCIASDTSCFSPCWAARIVAAIHNKGTIRRRDVLRGIMTHPDSQFEYNPGIRLSLQGTQEGQKRRKKLRGPRLPSRAFALHSLSSLIRSTDGIPADAAFQLTNTRRNVYHAGMDEGRPPSSN
jgi:hypothetical protein